jgi:hypothetical protein
LAKGDQGQIFSAWICVVLVAIDESLLILWITVLEKYLKYFTNYSSMDGLEAGIGTFYFSWERCYSRNGTGFFFIAGFGKLSQPKEHPPLISGESDLNERHDRTKLV